MTQFNIAMIQNNTTPKDIAGNVGDIIEKWRAAEEQGADLAVLPEQCISGYPLEDKARNPDVLAASLEGFQMIVEESRHRSSGIIVGLPQMIDGKVYNVAYLVDKGEVSRPVLKTHLPNEDVFDEKRIYTEGTLTHVVNFRGTQIGLMICEDAWHQDVSRDLKNAGAEILIAINASPMEIGKLNYRIDEVVLCRAQETKLPFIYVNQVGGVDELVFDGHSFAMNADGKMAALSKGYEETTSLVTLEKKGDQFVIQDGIINPIMDDMETAYTALVLGLRDYLRKTGFKEVVLGDSGGADSTLVKALACDAIGPENVHAVRLPSKITSDETNDDAKEAAKLMGVDDMMTISIQSIVDKFLEQLAPMMDVDNFALWDTTPENLQSRTRGTILMALSNNKNWLLLSTGNKSEMSVGYATLYGDTNGGFNPIKDLPKANVSDDKPSVFGLLRWRNNNKPAIGLGREGQVIPENIIDKPPTAELREGQEDTDSLPEYLILDDILLRYVQHEDAISTIAKDTGLDIELVEDMIHKVDIAEYKRRQTPPGLKITGRNFGKGRREPIVGPSMPRMLKALKDVSLELA